MTLKEFLLKRIIESLDTVIETAIVDYSNEDLEKAVEEKMEKDVIEPITTEAKATGRKEGLLERALHAQDSDRLPTA